MVFNQRCRTALHDGFLFETELETTCNSFLSPSSSCFPLQRERPLYRDAKMLLAVDSQQVNLAGNTRYENIPVHVDGLASNWPERHDMGK